MIFLLLVIQLVVVQHIYTVKQTIVQRLILQDPFFVPIIEELDNIELNTNSYFIYSQDWYQGYEDEESISEIEVYREYTKNKEYAEGYY